MYRTIKCIFILIPSFLGNAMRLDNPQQDIYQIVTTALRGSSIVTVRLTERPIIAEKLTESFLQGMVNQHQLVQQDIQSIRLQMANPSLTKWEKDQFQNIKIVKAAKYAKKGTWGVSIPVFSYDRQTALVYLVYLGGDMIFEDICSYRKVDGKWVYYQNLYSIMS